MHVCIHTHKKKYQNTSRGLNILTWISTYMHTHAHTCIYTHIHAYIQQQFGGTQPFRTEFAPSRNPSDDLEFAVSSLIEKFIMRVCECMSVCVCVCLLPRATLVVISNSLWVLPACVYVCMCVCVWTDQVMCPWSAVSFYVCMYACMHAWDATPEFEPWVWH